MKKRKQMLLLNLIVILGCQAQEQDGNGVSKNGMEVSWHHKDDRIFFEMSAPTQGWVTIGFNTSKNIEGAYLLMGHIVNKKPKVVEHYTISPGTYKPLEALGAESQVRDTEGSENNKITQLRFSLPIEPASKYQKNLSRKRTYTMILAYSQEDDFQHHSIVRTSINVKL